MAGSSGQKNVSNALSVSFSDGHAMDNMRTRIAARKEKKKQVAEEANKSLSSTGKAPKDLKKATTDDEGKKATKLIDRALHDVAGETEEMDDAKEADCAALRPLALKLAKVYRPCALVVKKAELMERVADAYGIRPRRKEGIVDWLIRVLYKLEYYRQTMGSWPMLESPPCSRGMCGPMWDGTAKQGTDEGLWAEANLGGTNLIAP